MNGRLPITGIGMVSSVGHGAVNACAAIRAGIVRPRAVHGASVLSLDSQEESPLTGHPVHLIGEGFVNAAKWLQLAPIAVEDLCSASALPSGEESAFWSRAGMIIVTPCLDQARFFPDEVCTEEAIGEGFVAPLCRALQAYCRPAEVRLVTRGRCGIYEALSAARADVEARRHDRVIVLAVDSLLDAPALAFSALLGQRKSDLNPIGLVPGEGAAALMVESTAMVERRGVSPAAFLGPIALGSEPQAFLMARQSLGVELSRVVDDCLKEASTPFGGDVISDHNGEAWRAIEYGHLQLRTRAVDWHRVRTIFPALSIGDVGAAAGAFGLVIAVRALQRGYANDQGLLVLTSDAGGPVASALIYGAAA